MGIDLPVEFLEIITTFHLLAPPDFLVQLVWGGAQAQVSSPAKLENHCLRCLPKCPPACCGHHVTGSVPRALEFGTCDLCHLVECSPLPWVGHFHLSSYEETRVWQPVPGNPAVNWEKSGWKPGPPRSEVCVLTPCHAAPCSGELRSQESSKLVVTNHRQLETSNSRNTYTTEIGKRWHWEFCSILVFESQFTAPLNSKVPRKEGEKKVKLCSFDVRKRAFCKDFKSKQLKLKKFLSLKRQTSSVENIHLEFLFRRHLGTDAFCTLLCAGRPGLRGSGRKI